MSLYLPVKAVGGTMAVAICYRCNMKKYLGDLRKDPNTGAYYCPECVDLYDPWKLPARKTEDIRVDRPRPDVELV